MKKTVAGILVFVLALAVYPALAQDCDQIFVDNVGLIKSSDVEAVILAAEQLAAKGVDVRVLIIPDMGKYSNLDHYEKAMMDNCPSWQATDGQRKNNLVEIIYAHYDGRKGQRKMGIYFGEKWKQALNDHWQSIMTQDMVPSIMDGDYDQAMIDGLRAVGDVIDSWQQSHNRTATSQPVVIQKEPTDLSGLWTFLKWFLALLVLYGIVFLFLRAKRENEKRQSAQRKAKGARIDCSSRLNSSRDNLEILKIKVKQMYSKVNQEDGDRISVLIKEAQTIFDNAQDLFGRLAGTANDPDTDGLPLIEYERMFKAYSDVSDRMSKFIYKCEEINRAIRSLEEVISSAPQQIIDTTTVIETATAVLASVESAGFIVPANVNQIMKQARESLDQAKEAMANKSFFALGQACFKADEGAKLATRLAENLPQKKQQLEAMTTGLEARIKVSTGLIENGQEVFFYISKNYHPDSWESIRGNGTESKNRVVWAIKALAEAKELQSMENQKWENANEVIDQANTWLDQVDSMMRSVMVMRENLDQAKENAAGEIDLADADIVKAHQYIEEHEQDITQDLNSDLSEANIWLEEARQEISKKQPNYIAVVKLAKQANSKADNILVQAEDQYQRAERQRRKAEVCLREAKRSLSVAKEYIEDHKSDVGISAIHHLQSAQTYMQQLNNLKSLSKVIAVAEKADAEADTALSKAKRDVANARSDDDDIWGSPMGIPRGHSSSHSSWSSPTSFPGGGGGGGSTSIFGGGGGGGSIRIGGGGGGGGSIGF